MDIGDYFRSLFGLRPKHNFPKRDFPDHECDCHDHDSFPNEGDGPPNDDQSLHDIFHHFHGDMHRQMEFLQRQMEDMMKGFGTIASENFPHMDRPVIIDEPESQPNGNNERPPFFHFNFSLPGRPDSSNEKNSPRDFMLKDGKEVIAPKSLPAPPSPPFHERPRAFGTPFRRIFPWNQPNQNQKEDTDLDGKMSGAAAVDLIKESSRDKMPKTSPNHGYTLGSSVTMTTVRGPDGKVEQKKVVKDSSGREESTVSRSVDGQCHTITTIMGPNGLEEKREDFKNMDQNDLQKFEEKWQSHQTPQRHPGPVIIEPPRRPFIRPSQRLDSEDMDIMARFFDDPTK